MWLPTASDRYQAVWGTGFHLGFPTSYPSPTPRLPLVWAGLVRELLYILWVHSLVAGHIRDWYIGFQSPKIHAFTNIKYDRASAMHADWHLGYNIAVRLPTASGGDPC